MSSNYDTKSSGQIEREVESSRADVESTLRALSDRMSPGQLVDQAYDYVKSSGGTEFAQNMGRQVRDNPLPLLLIGVGIGWLFMGGQPAARRAIGSDTPRRAPSPDRRPMGAPVESFGSGVSAGRLVSPLDGPGSVSTAYPSGSSGVGNTSTTSDNRSIADRAGSSASSIADGARETGRSAVDSVTEAAGSVRDRVSSASGMAGTALSDSYGQAADAASSTYAGAVRRAHQAGDALSETTAGVADLAAGMTETVRDTAVRASDYTQDRLSRLVEEQPLILGGIGLALGAALGASLPRTRMEDRLVGETADEFKTNVTDEATRQYDHAKDVVGETYDEVAQAVRESGVSEKLGEATAVAADKIRETTEDVSDKAREKIHASTERAKQKIEETGKSGSAAVGSPESTTSSSV